MHRPKWKLKMRMAGFLQNDRMLETYAWSKVWHQAIEPKMRGGGGVDSRWLVDDQSSQQVAFTLCLLNEGGYISLTLSPIRPRICWEPSRPNAAHLVSRNSFSRGASGHADGTPAEFAPIFTAVLRFFVSAV